MAYEIEYYHSRVLTAIEAWSVDVLADYVRLVELLMEHGPSLRLPHSRALGGGLFELRPTREIRNWSCVLLLSGWKARGDRPRIRKED